MRSNRKQSNNNIIGKIIEFRGLLLFGLVVIYFLFIIIRGEIKDALLDNSSKKVEAVIINKKNFYGNSPVSQDFTYSYKFKIDGEVFISDSHDKKLKIGDKVIIEYLPYYPEFNRMMHKY